MASVRWIVCGVFVVTACCLGAAADSTPALCSEAPTLDLTPWVDQGVFGPVPGTGQITCDVTTSGRLCTAECDCGNGNSISCSGPASGGCSVDDSDGTVTCGGDDKGSCTTPV